MKQDNEESINILDNVNLKCLYKFNLTIVSSLLFGTKRVQVHNGEVRIVA